MIPSANNRKQANMLRDDLPLRYDLHSHSTASDGTLSPTALVERAHANGVNVLALTDHDVTAGLDEAQSAADALSLKLVPGIEISVSWGSQTIHILGLNIDPANEALQIGLTNMRKFRDWRAEEIGRDLERHGITGAYIGAMKYAAGSIISRTHFARFLIEHGHAQDMQQVFKRFLVRGKPGYVEGEWASLEEALGWIHAAGGEAVVAHPARYKLSATHLRRLLTVFKEHGGTAIEVVSGSHGRDECRNMAEYARQFSLFASAGSDYHGPINPWMELGKLPELPSGCIPIWERWEHKQKVIEPVKN
jgi:predicted metal-dependent phosphoesterase TrpH